MHGPDDCMGDDTRPTDAISIGSVTSTLDVGVAELCESRSLPLQYLPPLNHFLNCFSGAAIGSSSLQSF